MDKNRTIKNDSKSRRSFLNDLTKWIGGTALVAAAASVFTSQKLKADTTSANGAYDAFIGEIVQFGYNFAPRNFMFCNGQLLPISSNTALFSILGTTYGGDGRTTFGIPDLRGRVAIGSGRGPGLFSYRLGEQGGVENVTLSSSQIPSHSHILKVSSNLGNTDAVNGNFIAVNSEGIKHYSDAKNSTTNNGSIGNNGGSQSHTNMQPYLAMYNCIAVIGTYPSRS